MRTLIAAAVACTLVGLSYADESQAAIRKTYNIPAQGLSAALQTLSRDEDVHVVFMLEDVDRLNTQGVSGEMTVDAALEQLLKGTGLRYERVDSETVTIVPMATGPANNVRDDTAAVGGEALKKSFWERFRVAEADAAAPVESTEGVKLEEIVVTAQKREEKLQDVPVPIAVVNGQTLINSDQVSIKEFYTAVPGLNLNENALDGTVSVSIRGLSSGNIANPTVAIVVDDVPYGASTKHGGGEATIDPDPNDVRIIEVLRGPQGTLYGASSIGGLLKYTLIQPSTDGFSGRLQGGVSGIENGDSAGNSLRGFVNIPVNETMAIRASAFSADEPGYIDNPLTGDKGVNSQNAYGGRVSALWRPSSDFSLSLGAVYQNSEVDGSSRISVDLPDLQQLQPGNTGGGKQITQIYTSNIKARISDWNVTSITSFSENERLFSFGNLITSDFVRSVENSFLQRKITQEVRLDGSVGSSFDWMFGGFYTREKGPGKFQDVDLVVDPVTGERGGPLADLKIRAPYEEVAAFADVVVHFNDRFEVQIGGRQSNIEQKYRSDLSLGGGDPIIVNLSSKEKPFTYLLAPKFKVSPGLMVYTRFASGYRPGEPNTILFPESAAFIPRMYKADKTRNYEAGLKGSALNEDLSFDISIYHIDWKDIQLNAVTGSPAGPQTYTDNAGKAKSQGVEFSVEAKPFRGTIISTWFVYSDASIDEDFPVGVPLNGRSGDWLPYASRYSGHIAVDHGFSLPAGFDLSLGTSFDYIGRRKGEFTASPDRDALAAYTKLDLRAALRRDTWTINMYVNNVADKRGTLGRWDFGLFEGATESYIRPRTFGMLLTKDW